MHCAKLEQGLYQVSCPFVNFCVIYELALLLKQWDLRLDIAKQLPKLTNPIAVIYQSFGRKVFNELHVQIDYKS